MAHSVEAGGASGGGGIRPVPLSPMSPAVRAVDVARTVVGAIQSAHSSAVQALTQALLKLVERASFAGHAAGVLQDLFAVYEVRGTHTHTHTHTHSTQSKAAPCE